MLTITYEKLLEIYFQNPQFGYYFLVLTSQRLLENIARLEAVVAQNKALQVAAAAARTEQRALPGGRVRDYSAAVRSSTFSARTAQNLNSGILPNGSSAGLVSRFAAASA